jgi:dTDP-4-amino-4,6-dideoxygalactose transaminase
MNLAKRDVPLIPLMRPTLPAMERVCEVLEESYASGSITVGKLVSQFEDQVCAFTGTRYAVAVSSCTAGLMLVFASMNFGMGAEVVVPSFTFPATVQALFWNGLKPVYVDCRPDTLTMDPEQVIKALGPKTAAVCPVTIFGLPPDLGPLTDIANRHGIPLISDSAQGLGSSYKGVPAGGFGLCEVFSLSPTKVITAVEGGLVTTNDRELYNRIRSMRDYGKGRDGEEIELNGLSARMSEFHAAVGLLNLQNAEMLIRSRLRLIRRYTEELRGFPGCRVQELPGDRASSGNYFALLIQDNALGDREAARQALKSHNIESKRYFYPPAHAHAALKDRPHLTVGDLPNTWAIARASLALPLYSHMTDEQQDRVVHALGSILAAHA